MDDLGHATAICDELGDTFCLTFVKGVDEAEALRRMGACPDTVARRTGAQLADLMDDAEAGHPLTAVAADLGRWSVVIEPRGVQGADHTLLEAVSRGTEALTVLRHDVASPHVGYAVDATTVVAFDPGYPAEEVTWGADPGLLRHLMRALDLNEPTEDGWELAVPRAMVLAQRVTGARLPAHPLAGPALSARIEPWFAAPAGPGDLLTAGRTRPDLAELVDAATAAAPDTQRTVAAAEVRRLAGLLGLAGTPGLAEALDAATGGTAGPVTVDSPLGRHVRDWITTSRRARHASRGPDGGADRDRADGYGWFVTALRGVLDPDPRTAVLAALRPLGWGPAVFGGPAARTAVVEALRPPR